jgi:hypothetical protein
MNNAETGEKPNWSEMWEGLYYLSFFIFSTLVVIPNLGKSLTFGYYLPIAMVIYGTAGTFVGILVYRLVKNQALWIKWSFIVIIYVLVLYQLLTHVDRFTIPDM